MKRLLISMAMLSTLWSCALQTYPPYQLYDGEPLATDAKSTVKVSRSFGGPAVYLTYVDNTYVLDYKAMKGYPKDGIEANRLEPKSIELLPGLHKFRLNFAFSDQTNKVQMITLLTLIGVSPVTFATFKKSADIEFATRSGMTYFVRYLWDESKGAEGIAFLVDECSYDEKSCEAVKFLQKNEQATITSNVASASQLMAR